MKLFLSALVPTLVAATSSASPSVTIDAGVIEGGKCPGKNAVYYKTIPYAEPPTGDLRFQPPKAYTKKYPNGKLNATSITPSCIQFGDESIPPGPKSEDCLYVDIWAPSKASADSKLPVKFWIYGGSDTGGGVSDTLYDGCNGVEDGSIIVAVNYRLGPLGFMALNKAGIYGNQGIQDILLGLKWVQSNIAAFGGDPRKVLLFGQSAGAADGYVVASLPEAPSLINSFISESGGGRGLIDNSTLQSVGASYARTLNCGISNKDCLRSKSVGDLEKAYDNDKFLKEGIGAAGALGIMSAKTHVFYPYADGKIIQSQYPLSKFKQLGDLAAFAAISQVITDSNYKCPAYFGAVQTAEKKIPAWTYEFSRKPTCPWMKSLCVLPRGQFSMVGAAHTSEIPYVFGNMQHYNFSDKSCKVPASEHRLSKQMISLWTAMAKNANPSTEAIQWPRFNGTAKSYSSAGLIFGNTTTSGDVDYKSCELWAKVRAMQSTGNATTTGGATNGSGSGTGSTTGTGTGSPTSSASPIPTSWIPTNSAVGTVPATGGILALSALLMGLGMVV
ncbi:hypothetical protein N7492_008605 [Penicillium capsulatum]|uniref:Carboxylic ester hydrolase n=1 Tax=Penicillium capsulatum TaxID=69766 RepID=A0A9W9LH94_9EURO|nr:hypothetical protein N7492_008605 [Penicillium capsulatum]